jgi:hypothetical protein
MTSSVSASISRAVRACSSAATARHSVDDHGQGGDQPNGLRHVTPPRPAEVQQADQGEAEGGERHPPGKGTQPDASDHRGEQAGERTDASEAVGVAQEQLKREEDRDRRGGEREIGRPPVESSRGGCQTE